MEATAETEPRAHRGWIPTQPALGRQEPVRRHSAYDGDENRTTLALVEGSHRATLRGWDTALGENADCGDPLRSFIGNCSCGYRRCIISSPHPGIVSEFYAQKLSPTSYIRRRPDRRCYKLRRLDGELFPTAGPAHDGGRLRGPWDAASADELAISDSRYSLDGASVCSPPGRLPARRPGGRAAELGGARQSDRRLRRHSVCRSFHDAGLW